MIYFPWIVQPYIRYLHQPTLPTPVSPVLGPLLCAEVIRSWANGTSGWSSQSQQTQVLLPNKRMNALNSCQSVAWLACFLCLCWCNSLNMITVDMDSRFPSFCWLLYISYLKFVISWLTGSFASCIVDTPLKRRGVAEHGGVDSSELIMNMQIEADESQLCLRVFTAGVMFFEGTLRSTILCPLLLNFVREERRITV